MRALVLAVLLGLGLPAASAAHVVVLPAESTAGGWERYSVIVPAEKDSPTVRVQLKLPAGMEIVALESKPGWQGRHNPFPLGAATLEWRGGSIARGEFLSFDFLAWNPPAARTIAWEATQWYADETSDRWGGAGDDDHHASKTVLKPGAGKPDARRHHHGPER
jgi:uncharacterized protein YcnI